jgi:hypothetical protein
MTRLDQSWLRSDRCLNIARTDRLDRPGQAARRQQSPTYRRLRDFLTPSGLCAFPRLRQAIVDLRSGPEGKSV